MRVPARVGLLGNPSDAFGGRVIATTIGEVAAIVGVERTERWRFESPAGRWSAGDVGELGPPVDARDLDGGLELLVATVARLSAEGYELTPSRVGFESTIPRQVGMAGSSAIVVGAIRALAAVHGLTPSPTEIARIALAVEVEGLGWAAGPQDRVVQSFGGLLDMRFDEPWDAARYERLDPALLPPFVVAWDPLPGTHSAAVHSPVRDRWEAGDAGVVAAMERFAAIAAEGRAALDAGCAAEAWPGLADESFELRTGSWSIAAPDRAMVGAIRSVGGGATLAGSGGAVVGHLPDRGLVGPALAALEAIGASAIAPLAAPG